MIFLCDLYQTGGAAFSAAPMTFILAYLTQGSYQFFYEMKKDFRLCMRSVKSGVFLGKKSKNSC